MVLTRRSALWIACVAVLMATSAYLLRRATVRTFFQDGAVEAGLPAPAVGEGLEAAAHVRVVVLDGLSREMADTLPHLRQLCSRGVRLATDNGFPTVSLPVQHVLWTGLTQQQSGLWYRIPRLVEPPAYSLPALVPGSVGVAESHPDIVGSFGFTHASPSPGDTWDEAVFVSAADAAIASDAALVFVHVLRIDEAGHADGASAPSYRAAAEWADARLGDWLSGAPAGSRWFVLADHGHLPGGGHGGAEPEIRIVRACVAGSIGPTLPRDGEVHLIDLSRALADSLGVAPNPRSGGRPLAAAIASPQLGATLPSPSPSRWSLAALALAAGLGLGRWLGGSGWRCAPWWLVIAYAGVVVVHGRPTLSNPVIYPPYGRDILAAALPGLLVLGMTGWRLSRDHPFWRYAGAQLATVAGLATGLGILCGAPQALLGSSSAPPLMPTWTAHTSVVLALCLGAGATLAIVGLAVAATRKGSHTRRGPSRSI